MSNDAWGKFYASTFTGSMVGAGPSVFAVWGYVIAEGGFDGLVDLNPRLLAATLGDSLENVKAAIAYLCAPDPESRSDADEGRRLRHERGVVYAIVNHPAYRARGYSDELKEYNKAKKQQQRAKQRALTSAGQPVSTSSVLDSLVSASASLGSDLDPDPERAPEPVSPELESPPTPTPAPVAPATVDPAPVDPAPAKLDHAPPPVPDWVVRSNTNGKNPSEAELGVTRARIEASNAREAGRARALEAIDGGPPKNTNPAKLQASEVIGAKPIGVTTKHSQIPEKVPLIQGLTRLPEATDAPTRGGVCHELPDDFATPEVVYARAAEVGIDRARVDERMAGLRDGPIGGSRGVLRKKLTEYLLKQVPKWRSWSETDALKARSGPGLAKGRALTANANEPEPWGPELRHRQLAAKLDLGDFDLLVNEYRRGPLPRDKTGPEVDRHFASWLKRKAKGVAA